MPFQSENFSIQQIVIVSRNFPLKKRILIKSLYLLQLNFFVLRFIVKIWVIRLMRKSILTWFLAISKIQSVTKREVRKKVRRMYWLPTYILLCRLQLQSAYDTSLWGAIFVWYVRCLPPFCFSFLLWCLYWLKRHCRKRMEKKIIIIYN